MPAAQDADPLVTAERAEGREARPALDTLLLTAGLVALWQVGTLALGREALPLDVATDVGDATPQPDGRLLLAMTSPRYVRRRPPRRSPHVRSAGA